MFELGNYHLGELLIGALMIDLLTYQQQGWRLEVSQSGEDHLQAHIAQLRQAFNVAQSLLDGCPKEMRFHLDSELPTLLATREGGGRGPRITIVWSATSPRKGAPGVALLEAIWRTVNNAVPLWMDHFRQRLNRRVSWQRKSCSEPAPLAGIASRPFALPRRRVIVFSLFWLGIGGAEAFAIQAIRLAAGSGFQVVAVCDQPGLQEWLPRIVEFVSDIYLLGQASDWLKKKVLHDVLHEFTPAAIHIHHSSTMYALLPLIRSSGYRGTIIDSTHIVENRHGGFVRLSRCCSQWIDYHHVVSRDLARAYVDCPGVDQRKIRIGYLLAPVHYTVNSRESFPDRPSGEPIRVAFVGRFSQQKRPYIFVEVARRLSSLRGSAFVFDMVGAGELEHPIRREIGKRQVTIALHDATVDVTSLLGKSNVLVICSDAEGLALVSYEAIASGCAVISTNVGAQHELIKPPMLLPVETYACIDASVALLLRVADGTMDLAMVVRSQQAQMETLKLEPSAADVCRDLYDAAFGTTIPLVDVDGT